MISVSHLTKRYGSLAAVDDLSFEVGKGEVVGFLGPNGAGKSTTLRILAGFLGMTSGKVTVAEHDIIEDSFEARKRIGYMPEAVPLYPEMRVREYLAFRAELKRVERKHRASFVDDAMKKTLIGDVAERTIGKLSKGYRQRVGLADALVAKPPLLILDEPTAGLDPNQIREVRELIRELGKQQTILLSTHILSEVESSCSRVILISHGKLVAEGPLDDIRAARRSSGVDVTVRGDGELAARTVKAIGGVAKVKSLHSAEGIASLRATWAKKIEPNEADAATEKMVAALVGAGVFVREITPSGGSLEDVFAALTTDHAKEESS